MPNRTPAYIQKFVDDNMYRMDGPAQNFGDEPNSYRKEWDTTSVRWIICASWVYEAAAGNQSTPAVYKAVNIARSDFLCDRYYLPATPRDMRMFIKAGIPVFGIESKHQLSDFDVVSTSIAYPLLVMNFHKMLSMSDIPPRRAAREEQGRHNFPMVVVGGQAYGAPEVLAPIVDAWWLGEVEDEPGNPGIGAVTARIHQFKVEGRWSASSESRLDCYKDLALEFNYLYFPGFVDVHYDYEDRTHVGLPQPSKQVMSYTSNLEGMRLPFLKRIIKDMDTIVPLDDPPLLYVDPANGSADIEVARGCPAWSIPCSALVEVAGRGAVRFDSVLQGERIRVGNGYHTIAGVAIHGSKPTVRVQTRQGHELICTSEHEVYVVRGGKELSRQGRDSALREWVHAEDLRLGDLLLRTVGGVAWPQAFVSVPFGELEHRVGRGRSIRYYSEVWPDEVTPDVAWFLGMATGDCYLRGNQLEFRIENRAPALQARLREVVKDLFDVGVTEYLSASQETTHFNLNSARMVKWLSSNFGIRNTETRKRVPDVIFSSPRDVVGAYLSALYDCNGSSLIPKSPESSVTLRFAVYSESQIRGVSELLRLLGLPSAVRSEVRDVKPDGSPAARPTRRWECRTTGSDDPAAYDWLNSLEPFKARHLGQFGPPVQNASAQDGLQYLEVTGLVPGDVEQVMDVDVPGPQAFNVNGLYVHNCSFCALSYRSKPYRQRTVPYMVDYAQNLRINSGGTSLTPFSPDFPMHTQRKKLIRDLLENVSDEVDSGAMRVDDFIADKDFILLQVHGGLDSVTLGVEGNSQRMRDLVGKGSADEDVKEAVTRGIRAGIRKFKMFMISNLPGEDEGDVFRILKLAKDLADIRDGMNQPHVRIQFSWTPLLIEANTPFQWFAPPTSTRALGDVWEEFRDINISFKLGGKSEPNKAAFFQLCQRASREVGEALVDMMDITDTACWGGAPKTARALLDERLRARGFLNGLDDAFDERFKNDLFGWEFIDQGISTELLWVTYLQMREFVEETDSHTYDLNFDDSYHGSEWIARCDTTCLGRTCGVCDAADLKKRRQYIVESQHDADIDLTRIVPVNQKSQAVKVRARLFKPERYRFIMNDHWRFNFRRAAYRATEIMLARNCAQESPCRKCDACKATPGMAKRSVKFVSDRITYKDWTSGVDYVEFAMLSRVTPAQMTEFIGLINVELCASPGDESTRWLEVREWALHPVASASMRTDADLSLWELELGDEPAKVLNKLAEWNSAESVRMVLKQDGGYFSTGVEEVNAKEYVDGLWLVRDGHLLKIRMLLRGRPSPYNIYAALMGRSSWLEAAKKSAVRLDCFVETDRSQSDFFRLDCGRCERQIETNIMDEPYDPMFCAQCRDIEDGAVVDKLTYA